MVTLELRETGASPKGSPLTNAELDNNFKNLDDGKQNTHPTLAALVGLSGSAGKIPVFSSETGMTTVDITATPDPKAFSVPATSVTRVAEAVHAALSQDIALSYPGRKVAGVQAKRPFQVKSQRVIVQQQQFSGVSSYTGSFFPSSESTMNVRFTPGGSSLGPPGPVYEYIDGAAEYFAVDVTGL